MPRQSRRDPRRRDPWLARTPSPDAGATVFLIPFSGCGASLYRHWPRLRGEVEFLPVELPGREQRFAEPTFATYQELAAAMAAGLAPHLDRPFAFFGHCGSALAAYEVTLELARSGGPAPTHLVVSSEVAPQDGPTGRYLMMDDDALAAELAMLITEQGGQPTDELIELHLGVLRADVEANKRYVVPAPAPVPCPITAVGWSDDTEVPHATMAGWDACGGEVTWTVLDGGHLQFMDPTDDLLALLAAAVQRVPAVGP